MSAPAESFSIPESLPGERLDGYLRRRYPTVSRSALQRLIEQGHVRVNDRLVKSTHHPRAGEIVSVHWPEPRSAMAQPEEIRLELLYEDNDLLVLNKAAGMVVHPAAGNVEHTLVNALLHHCAGQLSGIGGIARPGIVHRLDKDTSGCLVVAKNDFTHMGLSAQFSDRTVEKIYHAILCGRLGRATGEIQAAIARHPTQRKRMAVAAKGKGRAAHTTYRVIEITGSATLVEARIHTGRTHQIRVHFQHLGHPLAGDDTYGKRPNVRLREETGVELPRVMLHAHGLAFTHPRTGKLLRFSAPWPDDFAAALRSLGFKK